MILHAIDHKNIKRCKNILNQHHRLRHQVFVDKMGWRDLRRDDGLDYDEFDNDEAVQLCLTKDGKVVGGSRLNPSVSNTLLKSKFPHLVTKDIPTGPDIADWTRLYISPTCSNVGRKHSAEASALYCGIMEYALSEGLSGLTFVAYAQLIHLFISLGWKVDPLGTPQLVDGKATMAALLHVSELALDSVRGTTNINKSLLFWGEQRTPLRPSNQYGGRL